MYKYYVLTNSDDVRFCFVEDKDRSWTEPCWRIPKGIKMEHRFPENASLKMGATRKGIMVTDYICNTIRWCLVSEQLKDILKTHATAEIEFLPFKLINHKGRIAAYPCYVANLIGSIDCVDLTKTKASTSPSNPEEFLTLFSLELDDSKVPVDSNLFRIKNDPNTIVIREDLKEILDENNIIGMKYVKMGEPL